MSLLDFRHGIIAARFCHKKDDIFDQWLVGCVPTPLYEDEIENEIEDEDEDKSGGDNDKSDLMIWTTYQIMFYR